MQAFVLISIIGACFGEEWGVFSRDAPREGWHTYTDTHGTVFYFQKADDGTYNVEMAGYNQGEIFEGVSADTEYKMSYGSQNWKEFRGGDSHAVTNIPLYKKDYGYGVGLTDLPMTFKEGDDVFVRPGEAMFDYNRGDIDNRQGKTHYGMKGTVETVYGDDTYSVRFHPNEDLKEATPYSSASYERLPEAMRNWETLQMEVDGETQNYDATAFIHGELLSHDSGIDLGSKPWRFLAEAEENHSDLFHNDFFDDFFVDMPTFITIAAVGGAIIISIVVYVLLRFVCRKSMCCSFESCPCLCGVVSTGAATTALATRMNDNRKEESPFEPDYPEANDTDYIHESDETDEPLEALVAHTEDSATDTVHEDNKALVHVAETVTSSESDSALPSTMSQSSAPSTLNTATDVSPAQDEIADSTKTAMIALGVSVPTITVLAVAVYLLSLDKETESTQ